VAKKSRHQVKLEERIEQLLHQEKDWLAKAAECERIAGECEATRGELQAILDSVDGTNQEEEDDS
jgi:chromosome condensin MukBEF complex kleisin-like MukF subunit